MVDHENLRVRRATVTDKETIRIFSEALARETEAKALDFETLQAGVEAVLTDPLKGWYAVAEHNSVTGPPIIVGQILITFEWSDWRNGNFWWLQSLYVDQHHRKQGVFRQLYRYVSEEARKSAEKVCGFRLYVEQANYSAQQIYDHMGLQETSYQMYELTFSREH